MKIIVAKTKNIIQYQLSPEQRTTKGNKMKKAVKFEAINGAIVLFDINGGVVDGKDAVWEGSFCCDNNNLTSLEGAPSTVGGDFYCSNNNLTSLKGAPSTVGGDFYCYYNNNLTSLKGAPLENQDMFLPFLNKGYVLADGILTEFISKKRVKETDVFKTRKIGTGDIVWVAKKCDKYAHAKTLAKSLLELDFKTKDRDVEQYRDMPLDTLKTVNEWAYIYREVTGACQTGTEMFIESKERKSEYTLVELLKEIDGQYGCDDFKEVVGG